MRLPRLPGERRRRGAAEPAAGNSVPAPPGAVARRDAGRRGSGGRLRGRPALGAASGCRHPGGPHLCPPPEGKRGPDRPGPGKGGEGPREPSAASAGRTGAGLRGGVTGARAPGVFCWRLPATAWPRQSGGSLSDGGDAEARRGARAEGEGARPSSPRGSRARTRKLLTALTFDSRGLESCTVTRLTWCSPPSPEGAGVARHCTFSWPRK